MSQVKTAGAPPAASGPPPLAVVIAVNIIAEREERGLSQEQLAVYSHVTRETIGKLEAAREVSKAKGTTTRTLSAVASALDIDWTELVRVRPELAAEYDRATRVYLKGHSPALSLIKGGRGTTGPVQPPILV